MATTKRTVEVELSTTGLDAQGKPKRVPLVVDESGQPVSYEAPPGMEPDLEGEHMLINIGPQHPATHGVLRLVLELDGETVVRCIPHIGYLHCGFEKIGEYRQYNQIIPWTDREDYLNSPGNNVAFALGAERLFGITFTGHPDLRRLLMWEQYKEGYPLRKDFPLRGRFSRSEQLRQALAANPEARYSKEELSIADAFEDLPEDMRRRLGTGERTGE